MMKFKYLCLAAAAFGSFACTPQSTTTTSLNTNTTTANANAAAKPVPAAPTKESMMAMEKSAWEAWRNADSKFFEDFMSDRWVSFAGSAREDKAANIKRLVDSKCDVKSYSMSDDQLHMLGNDVAVLSYKAKQDATCAGTKIPAEVWVSSAFVREGDKWKAITYVENAVVDPNAAPAKAPAAAPAPPAKADGGTAPADALTQAVMAVETKAWDAWKNRDAKAMEDLMTSDFTYVAGSGRYDRAGSLKTWSEPKCEGNDFTFSDAKVVSVTPDIALATYKADVKGKCDGRPNPPAVWVASFNKKEGETWKNAFYTDVAR